MGFKVIKSGPSKGKESTVLKVDYVRIKSSSRVFLSSGMVKLFKVLKDFLVLPLPELLVKSGRDSVSEFYMDIELF